MNGSSVSCITSEVVVDFAIVLLFMPPLVAAFKVDLFLFSTRFSTSEGRGCKPFDFSFASFIAIKR